MIKILLEVCVVVISCDWKFVGVQVIVNCCCYMVVFFEIDSIEIWFVEINCVNLVSQEFYCDFDNGFVLQIYVEQ